MPFLSTGMGAGCHFIIIRYDKIIKRNRKTKLKTCLNFHALCRILSWAALRNAKYMGRRILWERPRGNRQNMVPLFSQELLKIRFQGCSIQAQKMAKMVTRLCHCQNLVSINLLTISGVSGVAWDFVCSMLHLLAATAHLQNKATIS